jgi:hypothetical protein
MVSMAVGYILCVRFTSCAHCMSVQFSYNIYKDVQVFLQIIIIVYTQAGDQHILQHLLAARNRHVRGASHTGKQAPQFYSSFGFGSPHGSGFSLCKLDLDLDLENFKATKKREKDSSPEVLNLNYQT